MSCELKKWEFRDPFLVVMSRQQAELKRSCNGCRHTRTVESPFGDEVVRCLKGRPYGRKCDRYESANEQTNG
ncbi:hypothetical protein F7890_21260 [Bordetella bronchiseptica]|nr:hypothetical protein F7D00_21260 [Bordetella bronchiseptica]KAB1569296.1 hypothetical protein F7890_21260 [Bordetella bronchiseptica]